ncbi:unnamed protein product [Thelazia callipaeda]|uniref:Anoctamin n=1 Tax=Thelazia callipaeda TaxID=103827 RepID=A0A0N5DBW4_THECL|nr:unnamed protein product [Thelazia callipaeda]
MKVKNVVEFVHSPSDVGYRSRSEFRLELQRMYDVTVYSFFIPVIFYIITRFVSLAMELKVTIESVDYITNQVNEQKKEYEDSVYRFVRDAWIVRKYYDCVQGSFNPLEELTTEVC